MSVKFPQVQGLKLLALSKKNEAKIFEKKNSSHCYLLNMCDEVLVVLRGRADTLEVFSGDMTDCIPAEVPSLLKTDILDQ